MKISLKKYGPIISEREIGEEIYSMLKNEIKREDDLEIDFSSIISMATYCAKQIFGRLYIDLTPKVFFERITLANVNDDVRIIIKMGIQSALEEHSPEV